MQYHALYAIQYSRRRFPVQYNNSSRACHSREDDDGFISISF